MRISIVTTNYNMGSYLQETIASVVRNLEQGDEYFVIDAASTDDSIDVIRQNERHLAGWLSEADRGYADGLSKGFAQATGDVLCWINSGDLLLDGAFACARKALADTKADLVFGDDFYVDEQSRVLRRSSGSCDSLADAMLYAGWSPLQDACFWKRDLYLRAGGLNPEVSAAADYDLFLRMALAGDCRYVPIVFSAFRKHRNQKSIAQMALYSRERTAARQRQLIAQSVTSFQAATRAAWHRTAWSIWVRVSPHLNLRPDLAGRPVSQLKAGFY